MGLTAHRPRPLLALAALTCLCTLRPAVAEEPGEQVRLSLERYGRLMRIAERADGPRITWGRGTVRVELAGEPGRPAEVTVESRVTLTGGGTAEVPLLPAHAVLRSGTVDGNEMTLLPSAGVHVALLEGNETVNVRLVYAVNAETGDDGSPFLLVPLPPVPGAALTVDGVSAASSVWPGVDVQRNGGRLTADLPATPAVVVRSGGDGTGESVRRAGFTMRPDASGDGVDVQAEIEVQVDGQKGTVRLAQAGSALIDVREGNAPLATRVVDGWHTAILNGRGRHSITARFRLAIDRTQGQPQVRLNPDNAPIAQVTLTVPGKREITIEPPVPLATAVSGDGDRAETRASAWLPPRDEVILKWTEARAAPETKVRVNTETFQLLTLEEGVLRSRVLARYDVIYGKLKELPIELPAGVVPYKVIGDGIEDWRVLAADGDTPRHVLVILGRELEGKFALELQIEQPVAPKEGTPIDLPLVHPMVRENIVIRQQGVVALFDGDKVGFAPATAEGYNKVGQDALPADVRQELRDKVNQAFKHLDVPGPIRTSVAAAKARDIRFDARVDTLYLVREGSLTAQASALVEIKSGRADKLHISVPEDVAEPRVSGPSLNKVEPDESFDAGAGRKAFAVTFTQALEGAVLLDIEFERVLKKEDTGPRPLPGIRIHGAEVESGSLGIAYEAGMAVEAGEAKDVRRIPVTELPKAVRLRSDLEVRLAWKYTYAPWELAVAVKSYGTVETLKAEAEQVRLMTHVLESGHIISRATYAVANDDNQYLHLTLPEEATVLRVTADGEKIKAGRDEAGDITIPLPKNRRTLVAITYEVRRDALGLFSAIDLAAPRADVRSRDLQWLVRVPADLGVLRVSTDLKRAEPYTWNPIEGDGADELPRDEADQALVFTQPVNEAKAPIAVALTLAGALGEGAGTFLLVLALIALVIVTRHRAVRKPWRTRDTVLIVIGVGALLLKAIGWDFEVGEGIVLLVVLTVVGLVSHRMARGAETK
ncbi:MAG: hypothetical protein KC620_10685 [Myxococcales bacterium]|nr:hypothetical protein [Myxococcales bacterium]